MAFPVGRAGREVPEDIRSALLDNGNTDRSRRLAASLADDPDPKIRKVLIDLLTQDVEELSLPAERPPVTGTLAGRVRVTIITVMARRQPFTLIYDPEVGGHLAAIEPKYHSLIRATIEEQLRYEPETATRNRKQLERPIDLGAVGTPVGA